MTTEKKTKFKKIYNAISTVITAVVFLFLIVVVVVTVLQKKQGEDVKIFGHYMYTVLTDSMEPTINPGDTIWCKAVTSSDIKEGAIITFTAPSGPLSGHNETHRISSITYGDDGKMLIRTKGDNSVGEDSWTLTEDSVKAVYVKTLPVISGLMSFMLEKPFLSYMLLIALPLIIVGVLFIVSYVKDRVKAETANIAAGEDERIAVNLDDLTQEERQKILDEFLLEQREKSAEPFYDDNIDNADELTSSDVNNSEDTPNEENTNPFD